MSTPPTLLENVPSLLTLTDTLVGYSCPKDILVSVEQMKRDGMHAKVTVPLQAYPTTKQTTLC